jgi:hypothetical protein
MKSMLCFIMLASVCNVDTYIMALVCKTNPRSEASTSWGVIVSMLQKEMQFMVQVKSNFQILVATISTLYFSVFAYGAFIIIQQFESVFDSFESELPIQTSLLIGSYRYWGILGLISAFILFKVSKCKSSKSMNVLIWLAVLSLLLIAFSIWGIYSPVLEGNGQT